MAYTDPQGVPRSALLAGAASAVLVVAAFLPWSVEAAGTFGGLHDAVRDGYLLLGVGVGVVAVAVVLEWNWIARGVAATGGFLAVYVFSHWHGRLTGAEAADVGVGLWLALGGGLGLLAAVAWGQFETLADDGHPEVGVVVDADAESPGDDADPGDGARESDADAPSDRTSEPGTGDGDGDEGADDAGDADGTHRDEPAA